MYDLVIRGGTVIDPAQGRNGRFDVAIVGGQIAAVAPSIPADQAARPLDASGKLVVPGLIDLHAHVFPGVGVGLEPDVAGVSRGATTVLDGGSAGASTFSAWLRLTQQGRTRVLAWLNLSSIGQVDLRLGELFMLQYVDPDRVADTIAAYPDRIVGIKARLSTYVCGFDLRPVLQLLRRAADAANVPVMVHVGDTAEPLPVVLDWLRPGDVVTHTLTGRRYGILGPDGKVLREVRAARERGIRFDAAAGRMHFSFPIARAAVEQDFVPDSIATDLTVPSSADPDFTLMNLLSRMLALGLPLQAAIALATSGPAGSVPQLREAGLGSLGEGAPADLTLLELLDGRFALRDADGVQIETDRRLRLAGVVRAGDVLPLG